MRFKVNIIIVVSYSFTKKKEKKSYKTLNKEINLNYTMIYIQL